VPVAEITLDPADSVFFEHHVMLWKDSSVRLSVMSLAGGMKRVLAGMPFVISAGQTDAIDDGGARAWPDCVF